MEQLYIGTDGEYADDEIMLDEPACRPVLNCLGWMRGALAMLVERWVSWLVMGGCIFMLELLLFVLFSQGGIMMRRLAALITPVALLLVMAGMQYAASAQEYDEEAPHILHLFMPFAKPFEAAVLNLSLIIISVLTWGFLYSMQSHLGLSKPYLLFSVHDRIIFGLLAGLCLSIYSFLFWFAPTLVFLRDESPFSAIVMSFKSGFKNILSFIVFFLVQWLILWVALVVIFSILFSGYIKIATIFSIVFLIFYQSFISLCCYFSYRDIWFEESE